MKTKKLTRGKAILALVLALVLAVSFYLAENDSYAEGSIAGTVTRDTSWPDNQSITFNLYKVGDYGHDNNGNVIYVLDQKYAGDAGVVQQLSDPNNYGKKPGDEGYADWTQKWLDTANALSTHINSKVEDKPASAGTATVTFAEGKDTASFSIPNLQNGLYLLVGSSFEADNKYWTPQPMLVSVLNGNRDITYNAGIGIKMISRNIAHEHSVLKTFVGDNGIEDYIRPEKIAVKIMYGSEDNANEVDTVILDSSSSPEFYYNWKDKVHYSSGDNAKKTDDDVINSIDYIVTENGRDVIKDNFVPVVQDGTWFVKELRGDEAKAALLADIEAKYPEDSEEKQEAIDKVDECVNRLEHYTTKYGTTKVSDNIEKLDITNTYTYQKLVLTKKIDEYYEDADDAAFSFLIEGFDADGTKIYENHLGVVINQNDDKYEKTVELNYIPENVASLNIKEEYSGNYKNVKLEWNKVTPEEGDEDQIIRWEAVAENTHTGHTPGGGVVNQYRHDQEDTNKPNKVGPER